jgi:hypothetical protein
MNICVVVRCTNHQRPSVRYTVLHFCGIILFFLQIVTIMADMLTEHLAAFSSGGSNAEMEDVARSNLNGFSDN